MQYIIPHPRILPLKLLQTIIAIRMELIQKSQFLCRPTYGAQKLAYFELLHQEPKQDRRGSI